MPDKNTHTQELIDTHLDDRPIYKPPHYHREALSAFIRYDDRSPDKLTIHIRTRPRGEGNLDSVDIPLHCLTMLKNDIDYIVENLEKKESE